MSSEQPTLSPEQAAQEIVNQFASVNDWEDRYERLIQEGKSLPPLPADLKSEKYLIEGCLSKAWLAPDMSHPLAKSEARLFFKADSEAAIVKGILALLVRVYSGRTGEEILNYQPKFLEELDLSSHLSSNRRNGLSHILRQIQLYATVINATFGSKP